MNDPRRDAKRELREGWNALGPPPWWTWPMLIVPLLLSSWWLLQAVALLALAVLLLLIGEYGWGSFALVAAAFTGVVALRRDILGVTMPDSALSLEPAHRKPARRVGTAVTVGAETR